MGFHYRIHRQNRKHKKPAGISVFPEFPQKRQAGRQIQDPRHHTVTVEQLNPSHIEIMLHIARSGKSRPCMDHAVVFFRVRQRYDPAVDKPVYSSQQHNVVVIPRIQHVKLIPLGIPHPLGTDCRIHRKTDAQRKHQQTAQIGESLFAQKSAIGQHTCPRQKKRGNQHTCLGFRQHKDTHIEQHHKQIQIPFHLGKIDIDPQRHQHQEHTGKRVGMPHTQSVACFLRSFLTDVTGIFRRLMSIGLA